MTVICYDSCTCKVKVFNSFNLYPLLNYRHPIGSSDQSNNGYNNYDGEIPSARLFGRVLYTYYTLLSKHHHRKDHQVTTRQTNLSDLKLGSL